MTDADSGEKAVYKVFIEAPIETVWNELVKTDTALPFFFGAVCRTPHGRLDPGEPMAMRSPNDTYTSVVGRVLEFSPPHRYAHTLMFTQFGEAPVTVTYDLREVDGGTEFTLTTTGGVSGSKTAKSMAQGGPLITKTLKQIAETGSPGLAARLMLFMIGAMQPFTPAVCRTENWPFEKIKELSLKGDGHGDA